MEDIPGDWESQAESGKTNPVDHKDAEQLVTQTKGETASKAESGRTNPVDRKDAEAENKAASRAAARGSQRGGGKSLAAACKKHDRQAAAAKSTNSDFAGFVGESAREDVDEMERQENTLLCGTAAVTPTEQTAAQIKFVEKRKVDSARAVEETIQLVGDSRRPQPPMQSKSAGKKLPVLGRDKGLWDIDDDYY